MNIEVCPPAVLGIQASELVCQYVNAYYNNVNCVSQSGSSTTCAACPPHTCSHASPCGTLHVERKVTLLSLTQDANTLNRERQPSTGVACSCCRSHSWGTAPARGLCRAGKDSQVRIQSELNCRHITVIPRQGICCCLCRSLPGSVRKVLAQVAQQIQVESSCFGPGLGERLHES